MSDDESKEGEGLLPFVQPPKGSIARPALEIERWQMTMGSKNAPGRLKLSSTNLRIALHVLYKEGHIKCVFDELSNEFMHSVDGEWRRVDDYYYNAVRIRLVEGRKFGRCEWTGNGDFKESTFRRVFEDYIRTYHTVNLAKIWLESLPEWDGADRLEGLLVTHFGAENTALNRRSGKKLFCDILRRIFAGQAGAKVDEMLVLGGSGGIYKSTALAALLPSQFFAVAKTDIESKDTKIAMQGHLLVEVAELAGMIKDPERLKNYLSTEWEYIRGSYGRKSERRVRTWVLVGTTNNREVLNEAHGNRRVIPIWCNTKRIDVELLRAQQDQLWAQAYHHHRNTAGGWLELYSEDELAQLAIVSDEANKWDTDMYVEAFRDLIREKGKMVPWDDQVCVSRKEIRTVIMDGDPMYREPRDLNTRINGAKDFLGGQMLPGQANGADRTRRYAFKNPEYVPRLIKDTPDA